MKIRPTSTYSHRYNILFVIVSNLVRSGLKFHLVAFALFFIVPLVGNATIRYVKVSSSGSGNGADWANASNSIQNMISSSSIGDSIFVASGTYTLSSTINWNKAVNIFGGFDSNNPVSAPMNRLMSSPTYKPWNMLNASVLDGSNNKQILSQSVFTNNAVYFDGFTLTKGSSIANTNGGAAILKNGGTIRNCVITNSTANGTGKGGGVSLESSTSSLIQSLVFNCKGTYGGGVSVEQVNANINRCHISNCTATIGGGGVDLWKYGVVVNSILSNNYAPRGGGVRLSDGGSVVNCTVESNNSPKLTGRGILYDMTAGQTTKAYVYNTLLGPNNSATQNIGAEKYNFWDRASLERIADYNVYLESEPYAFPDGSLSLKHFDGQLSAPADSERPWVKIDGYNNVNQMFTSYSSWTGYDNSKSVGEIGDWTLNTTFSNATLGGHSVKDGGDNEYYDFSVYGNYDIYGNPRWLHNSIDIGAVESIPVDDSNNLVGQSSVTYNGSPQEMALTLSGSNVKTTINDNISTGYYTITYKAPNGNVFFKSSGGAVPVSSSTPNPTDVNSYTVDIEVVLRLSGKWARKSMTFTVNPKPITIAVSDRTKVYDGGVACVLPTLSLSQGSGANQVLASDWNNVSINGSAATASYNSKSVGNSTKTVTVTGITLSGSRSGNYSIAEPTSNSTSTITTAPLSVSGVTANNKVYNGLNNAAISGTALLVGKLGSDDVVLVASSSTTFASPNVASGIAVTSAFSLSGVDKDNYSLAQPTLSANITPAPLSVTFASLVKTYDGNNSAAIPALTVVGIQNSESVTASATGSTYDTKNVGTGKTVTLTGVSFTAPINGNYTLGATAFNSLGVINAKDVTGTLNITFPDVSKTYDGTTSVAAILPANFTITGLVAGNVVTVASYTSAAFDTKHVGNAKVVTVSGLSFAGADVGNYTLPSSTTNSNSSISKMAVTITVNAAQTKVYDKNSANPLSYAYSATPLPGGDTYVGALVRNLGENAGDYPITQGTLLPKTVGQSSAAANYDVTFVSKDFRITAKNLTIPGIAAQNKIYDAATTAILSGGSLVGVVGVDDVSFSYTANFVSKNIGNGQTVNAAFSLNGSTAPNYTLTSPSGFTANISKRDINAVGFSIADKGADGNNSATIANWGVLQVIPVADAGKVSINQTGVIATFDDVTGAAGINKPVSVTPISLQGSEAANYNLIQPSGLTASINASQATFDWNGFLATVVYNGLGHPATVFVSNGGALNTVPTIEYKDGLGNVMGSVPTDAGTYTVKATSNDLTWTGSETRVLVITPKTIPAATFANAGTKVYDATTNVSSQPTLILTGIEARDLATVTASGDAAQYNLATILATTVTINNIVLNGTGKDNYIVPSVASNSTWTITKRDYTTVPLSFSFGNQSKVFDGNVDVLPDGINTPIVITGFLPGDMFTAQAASASYDNRNVEIGNKTVTLSGITYSGVSASNYTLPTTLTNTTSSILPLNWIDAGAKMTISDQTKVYDGDKTVKPISVPAVQLTGLIAGTTVTATGSSASYDNKNVGDNKTVTVRGIVFTGSDALNYTFPDSVQNLTSSITPISIIENGSLVLTFANQTKEYDATPIVLNGAGVPYVPALTVQGLLPGDVVTAVGTSATYNNKDVGVNKTITVRGVQFGGPDAINYVFADSAQNINSSITAKAIGTQAWLSFANQTKVYDGTRKVLPVSVPAISVNGLVGGDVVTAAGSIAFYDNKNVGVNKTVTIRNVVLSGKDKDNYLLADSVINILSSITPRSSIDTTISVSFANQTKVFDHTSKVWPDSTDTNLDIHGLVAGDVVTGKATSAYYVDPNVGVSKRVTLDGIIYSGADAGNYVLPNTVHNDTCTITKLDITKISDFKIGFGQQVKAYDGTTVVTSGGIATIPAISISGLLGGDVVVATADSAAYDSKTAKSVKDVSGKIKTVTLSNITYSGSSKDNYILPTTLLNDTCIINPVDPTILSGFKIAFDDVVKEYDGTTNAVISNLGIKSGLISGDVVTVVSSDSARFDSKNVSTGKVVTAYGIKYTGADTINYILPKTAVNSNCEIYKYGIINGGLVIDFAPCDKIYDGTTSVKIGGVVQNPVLVLHGLFPGDDVSVTATKSLYDDKSAKNNKVVVVSDLVVSGADAGNYSINSSYSTANNSIQKFSLTTPADISVQQIAKIYDGTPDVAVIPTLTPIGLLPGDVVTLSGSSASYDSSNAGNPRTVTVSGIVAGGVDAANYTFSSQASNNTCVIVQKPVTLTPDAGQTRAYDAVSSDLTYKLTPSKFPNNSTIVLNGKLAWDGNNDVGVYTILQGTITNANNPNFLITFSSNPVQFSITSDIEIVRKWQYVLVVNNTGDRFSGYQWYVNGTAIPGATKQTYSNKDKSLCGKFVCEVVFRKDGARVKSLESPQAINCTKLVMYKLFPSLVPSGGMLKVKNVGDEVISNSDAMLSDQTCKVEMYSTSGVLIKQYNLNSIEDASFEAPSASGVYIVLVSKNGDLILTDKVIVK